MAHLVAEGSATLDRSAPSTSQWNVGEQIDHTVKVGLAVCGFLQRKQSTGGKGPSPVARLILFTGRIPRGRARAPERVLPEKRTPDELAQSIASLRESLASVSSDAALLASNERYFKHPFLGDFTAKEALRFLEVHTSHHIRIIGDILKGSG